MPTSTPSACPLGVPTPRAAPSEAGTFTLKRERTMSPKLREHIEAAAGAVIIFAGIYFAMCL